MHYYCVTTQRLYTCNPDTETWTLTLPGHITGVTQLRLDCVSHFSPLKRAAEVGTPVKYESITLANLRNHVHVLGKLAQEFGEAARLVDDDNLSHLLHCVCWQANTTSPGRSM